MRTTDDRYAGETARFQLALRLIGHQARTHIITFCTGFSQDRVRKLWSTYYKSSPDLAVKRRRGKSPSSVDFFVRNPWIQAEATFLVHVLAAWGLLRIQPDLSVTASQRNNPLRLGQRFCDAYEDFRAAQPRSAITFEHAWALLGTLAERREMRLLDCVECASIYVKDALALDARRCPACRVTQRRQPPAELQLVLPIG